MDKLTVIFDIDGVIVDSEQLHFDVLRTVATEQTQHVAAQQLIGLSLEETLSYIGIPPEQQPSVSAQVIETYKAKLAKKYLRPGVIDLINLLEQRHIPFGFVSTAPRDVCLANINLLGLLTPIKLIAGNDVKYTKPHPEPYLTMMTQLKANINNTIVIEDTDLGISSAYDAGLRKIYAWPHPLSTGQNYHQATAIINHLDEIVDLAKLKN
ncbi:HAD family hydrolase [Arsenophonus apicola]|jgi:beta-phosphoglucomutase|uniref:HAD family hydrolase n=1 Tax=Arsenophonus apicola TaxID=2879119 RepID=UPI00387A1105